MENLLNSTIIFEVDDQVDIKKQVRKESGAYKTPTGKNEWIGN